MRTGTVFVTGLITAGAAIGQTAIDLRTQTKSVDFSTALTTKPSKAGTVLPSSCSPGETFLKLNASPGQNFYVCTTTNSWTPQSSSGTAGPHAATHQHGGSDEVATPTPGAWAIPQANATGKLSSGWIDFTGYQTALGFTPLNRASNLGDLSDPQQARINLGLGAAALKTVDGTGTTVPTMLGTFAPNAVLIRDTSGSLIDSGCTITAGAGIGCPGDGLVIMKESATPAPPLAGYQTLFFDAADHSLKTGSSSGTITPLATTSKVETFSNKTLVKPVIGDYSNAGHNHADAAGGGQIGEAAIKLTDTSAGNATASQHGFLPKLSGNASDVLKGDGTFGPGGGGSGSGIGTLYTFNFKLTNGSGPAIPGNGATNEISGSNFNLINAAIPADCTFQNLYLALQNGDSVAAGKTVTAAISWANIGSNAYNGTATPVTCAINGGENNCHDTSHTGAVPGGSSWVMKVSSNDSASHYFVGAVQCK